MIEVPIAVAPVEAMTVTELAVGVDYLDARGNRRQHRFVVPVCIAP